MPGLCAVSTCNSHRIKTKGTGIKYHSFPKDPEFRAIWILMCKSMKEIKPATAQICSLHFEESDYLRDLKSELLGLPPKRILKETAVPSLKIPKVVTIVNLRRESTGTATNSTGSTSQNVLRKAKNKSTQTKHLPLVTNEKLVAYSKTLLVENRKLKNLCDSLQTRFTSKREELAKARKDIATLKANNKIQRKKEIDSLLKRCFTPGQRKCLINRKKCSKWTEEDIIKAEAMYAVLSKKAYTFLLQKMNYPLPAVKTLRRWRRTRCINSNNIVNSSNACLNNKMTFQTTNNTIPFQYGCIEEPIIILETEFSEDKSASDGKLQLD